MGLDGYTPNRGPTPNRLNEQQQNDTADRIRAAREPACDLVYVYDYDPVNQTVDVVLMNNRRSQPLRGIPLSNTGGHGARYIRAWQGVLDTDKPDIGLIVYPRLGGGRKFLDFVRRDVNAIYAHIERTAVFMGGVPASILAGETATANVLDSLSPATHEIGKRDNGLVKPSGAGIILKDNDDIVLRGARIILLGLDQVEADANAVARQGDAGDGGGGTIAGGSSRIYAG